MTDFRVLAVNPVNQLMNQITPALFWEIYDVLLCMIRQESEETIFFIVVFTYNGLPSLCYIDRKYTIRTICSENQSNPLLGGLIYKMSKSFCIFPNSPEQNQPSMYPELLSLLLESQMRYVRSSSWDTCRKKAPYFRTFHA